MKKHEQRPGGIPWVRPDEPPNQSPFQSEVEVPEPHTPGYDPPQSADGVPITGKDLPHLYENAQGCLFREDLSEFHLGGQASATDPNDVKGGNSDS